MKSAWLIKYIVFALLFFLVGIPALYAQQVADSIVSKPVKTLQGIRVNSKTPYISQTDQITINVAASPLNAGSNTWEAILRVPGVTEQANNLQFRGQGISVYINNRPLNLAGEDLKNYLGSLPANTVEKIEILLQPSAKYGAQSENPRYSKTERRG